MKDAEFKLCLTKISEIEVATKSRGLLSPIYQQLR